MKLHRYHHRFHHNKIVTGLLILLFLFVAIKSASNTFFHEKKEGMILVYPSGPVDSEDEAVRIFQEYLNNESVDPEILAGTSMGTVYVKEYVSEDFNGWRITLGRNEFFVSRGGGVYKKVGKS